MNKKLMSPPSIELSLEQNQTGYPFVSRDQYLKSQCRMRQNALKTAQNLIIAYQKESEDLKQQNHKLKHLLKDNQQSSRMLLQEKEDDIKMLQQNLFKYSQRINELLEQNIDSERKINNLQRQIDNIHQQYQAQQQSKKNREKLKDSELRQRKEVEKHFKNYLRIAPKQDSLQIAQKKTKVFDASNSLYSSKSHKEQKEKSEVKVLSWRLKQKEEEIVIVLKRLRDLQSKYEEMQTKFHRERIVTSDTADDYNTKKNISQFCN